MSDAAPTVFSGRYKLGRRLAEGGMASVFLGEDELLGRRVAVKVLLAQDANNDRVIERFRREAKAAASLNHPNIVSVHDWGEHSGAYYLVMEYVEGESLAQMLVHRKRLGVDDVMRVASDVATALKFAHAGGVVHRDIKPSNILVTAEGRMKVADFGIATVLMTSDADNLTMTGSVMGTAAYFSPEQALGHKVDNRSDLYSLGVVLYELLVGEPPFTGGTHVSVGLRHVQEPPRALSDHGQEIPPVLAAITLKLLAKNPDDRYPSADALLTDLRRYEQRQQPLRSAGADVGAPRRASPLEETTELPAQQVTAELTTVAHKWRWIERAPWLGVVAAILCLSLLGGCAVLFGNNFGLTTSSDGSTTLPAAAVVETGEIQLPTRPTESAAPLPTASVVATSTPMPSPTAAPTSTPTPTPTAAPTSTPIPQPPTAMVAFDTLRFKGKELEIDLTNTGADTRTVTAVTITFPVGVTGNLEEIKHGKDKIYNPDGGVTSPATVTSNAWERDVSEREIEPGETEEFTFKFDDSVGDDPLGYTVTFSFDDESVIAIRA